MKNRRKNVSVRIIALLLIVVLLPLYNGTNVSAKSKKVSVRKVTITNPSKKTLTLNVGKTYKLKVTVAPSKATNKKVSFKSSNSKIVSVNSKGKLTAKKNGTAKITVTAKDGSKKKAELKVNVVTPVTKVTVAKTNVTKVVGTSFNIGAKVSPSTATVKTLKYTTSNASIAKVDKKGNVKLLKAGTVKITATATDGSKKHATCTIKVTEKTPAATVKPTVKPTATPSVEPTVTPVPTVEPTVAPTEDPYTLVWEDTFDGTELNTDNWNYELHEPGWVNNELQEYTDSKENTYVKDGKLIIQAIKNADGTYTSGRINTQNKHDQTYGKFEIKAKSPSGQGFLPAIWMMPTDENLYGQWPKCGEIDIMEVLGSKTNTLYSTLHFGEPHAEKQGSYTLANGTFADSFHTYTCEWEPGEIRFYVDGILFQTVNDWFTKKDGYGEVTYPAPFDQDFYLILNLAVGGNWPGNPDETTTFDENAQLVVDYVKVYQKEGYDENVQKPENSVTLRDPDATGNYIVNGDFSANEELTDNKNWGFLLAGTGNASAAIKNNALTITTTDCGNLDYSVQVVQPNLPMEKGKRYKLTFDAYASEARTMITDVSGPDNGYKRYMADTRVELTTETKTYTYEFDMKSASDANGRLEFNLGNQGSNADVVITNVRLEHLGDSPVSEDEKIMLPDGNYIFNGGFQEGTDRFNFWTVEQPLNGATVSVTNIKNRRELKVEVPAGTTKADALIVSQKKVALSGGKTYNLYFDAYGDANKVIETQVGGQVIETTLTAEKKTYKYTFTTAADLSGTDLQFLLGTAGTCYLDNVGIYEDCLLINGDFSNGLNGFEVFADSSISSNVTYGVDSQKEKDAFTMDITNTGDADWKIQLKQNNIKLEEGKYYTITLDAKSTLDRQIMFALQRDGSSDDDWTPYSGNTVIDLTGSFQTFSTTFKMTRETDPKTILSIAMGAVGNKIITEKHTVTIDNIKLVEVDAATK